MMKTTPIRNISVVLALALFAGCQSHTSYQVHLVGTDGESLSSLTRTRPDEDEMIETLESFFHADTREPEAINRYLTEAKLFLAFFPDSPERVYVLYHGIVAALRGIETPPTAPGAYSVEVQYVRHGFAQEALTLLGELRKHDDQEAAAFLRSLSHTLEKGIWYDQAMRSFSSALLQSVVLIHRHRLIAFDGESYASANAALRHRYPKWHEDTHAAAVAEQMPGGTS